MVKICIEPKNRDPNVTGGIARVVDAQNKWLPQYGIDVVTDSKQADVLVVHATAWVEPAVGQRVVSHCHGLYWVEYNWEYNWYTIVNKQVIECMRKADVVTVPTEWVANSIRRGMQFGVDVIGHGVDLDEFELGSGNEGYVYWDKSRVDPVCDPAPVNQLAGLLPDILFVSTFGERAKNVHITGAVPYERNKATMSKAGLYLCTARETFGISILEAMALGVPVVGWNYGGQAEIVEHKVTGWLAEPGDYTSLQQGVRWALSNRDELSKACRRVVEEKYQWKDVVGAYANLYTSLAETSKPGTISVVMPSYNLSKYLEQAANSVIEQLKDTDELIIVDDNSTDGSYELAKNITAGSYACSVIQTPQNLYLAGALNYGIERATGEYIMCLDADNVIEPETLNTLRQALDKDRSLDIAYGKVKFVVEDGMPDKSVSGDGISGWPPADFSYEGQMAHRNQIPSTCLYRKKLWIRVGGYRQRCRTAEDADFWCRVTSTGATAKRVTDAVTLVYRNRNESMSHTQSDWPWELWYNWCDKSDLTPYGAIAYRDRAPVLAYNYSKPLVSIVIPVGPGHSPQDALDSVYAQNVSSWECIVVNDTGTRINRLPQWVRVLDTGGKGLGVSVARNIGIRQAKGQFFILLDADDYIEPDFIQKTYRAHMKNGGYVYTNFRKAGTDETVRIAPHECKDMLNTLIHPITCLYPIAVRDKVQFDETMRVGEDWDYVLGVLAAGWCGTRVDEPLLYYRIGSGNNRKQLIENIDQVRAYIQSKWGGHMACGCGQGGGTTGCVGPGCYTQELLAVGAPINNQQGDMVLIEFVKPDTPKMTWTGAGTGTNYRFGSGQKAYVYRSDAEKFLQRDEFELAIV